MIGANTGLALNRLLAAGEDAAAILERLPLPVSGTIGLETSRHLIASCLQWQNERQRSSRHGVTDSDDLIIVFARFNILIAGDGTKPKIGRLGVTAIARSEFGPFIGFAVGFGPATWATVAAAHIALKQPPDKVVCLENPIGGMA